MSASQWKLRAPIMIKQRRFPFRAVVAFRATRDSRRGELFSVCVLVAVLANHRRGSEIRLDQLGLEVGWFVARDASSRTVGSYQRERCLRVVEARQLLP